MNFTLMTETKNDAYYFYYSEFFFTQEIYFGVSVNVIEYRNDDKQFYVGIKAVSLKTPNLSFRLDLSVKTLRKTMPEEERVLTSTMNIENHDGRQFENSQTYDYVPTEELEIVLKNIEIEPYSKEEYETKEFLISLPTRSTFDLNADGGDFTWYRNNSPKQTTTRGKGC